MSKVSASNKGAALGAYGLFIDISLGVTGPLVGFVAKAFGMGYIFPFSMAMVVIGLFVCVILNFEMEKEKKSNTLFSE